MGTIQIMLIVVGFISVGTAVAMGITLLDANAETANRDALTQDCLRIASAAEGYYGKPELMGGGGQAFDGISLGDCGMQELADGSARTANGTFAITRSSGDFFAVTGTSPRDESKKVSISLDMTRTLEEGKERLSYAGW
jgi:hypothetical protein